MARVASYAKKRFKRSRSVIPSGRRPIRTRSLFPRREILIRKGRTRIKKILPTKRRMFKKFHNPFRVGYAFTNFDRRMGVLVRSWFRKQTEWNPTKIKTDWTSTYRHRKPFTPKTTRKKGFTTSFISKAKKEPVFKRINEQRKSIEDAKKVGLRPFKKFYPGRARKHPWKGTNKFGPVGPLGPHLVISIIATTALTRAIKKEEELRSRGDYIRHAIHSAMDTFRAELMGYAKTIIDRYVPKETGDLQNTLIEHLEKGKRRGFNLNIEIATDRNMMYAKPVNRMPEKMIQHSASMGRIGRRSHSLLHDPKAQKGFYNHVRMLLSTKAKELLREMIIFILASTKSVPKWTAAYKRIHPKVIPIQGQRTRVSEADRLEWVKEKNKTKHIRLREKKYAKQTPTTKYTRRDVLGWFTIQGLNKR